MTWLKAKAFLLSIALLWAFFVLAVSPLQIPVTIGAAFNERLKRYAYGIWIAQDQYINALFGGNPDVTISSKVGWMAERGSKTAQAMAVVIDYLFYISIGQVNHCAASIERDEAHHEFN